MDELERKIALKRNQKSEQLVAQQRQPGTYHGDVFIERPVHCSELQLARKANVAKRIVNICKQQPVEQGQVVYLR